MSTHFGQRLSRACGQFPLRAERCSSRGTGGVGSSAWVRAQTQGARSHASASGHPSHLTDRPSKRKRVHNERGVHPHRHVAKATAPHKSLAYPLRPLQCGGGRLVHSEKRGCEKRTTGKTVAIGIHPPPPPPPSLQTKKTTYNNHYNERGDLYPHRPGRLPGW